jgi:hypothetical protein
MFVVYIRAAIMCRVYCTDKMRLPFFKILQPLLKLIMKKMTPDGGAPLGSFSGWTRGSASLCGDLIKRRD